MSEERIRLVARSFELVSFATIPYTSAQILKSIEVTISHLIEKELGA